MKIVIVVEDFHPTRWYLEHYLAYQLAQLGHEVHVFTFDAGKYNHFPTVSFKVHRLPCFAKLSSYHLPSSHAFTYVSSFVRKEKPNIIHCQPLFSPLSLLFLSCKLFARYDLVGSLISGPYSIDSLKSKILYYITKIVNERLVVPHSKLIFVKSDGLRKLVLQLFDLPKEKIRVVPLGADSNLFKYNEAVRADVRKQLGMSKNDLVILCSGKISPSKHYDELLKALTPIIKSDNKVKLLLLGEGNRTYLNTLKSLCSSLGITNNVLFHPFVNRSDIPSLFNACDIAVWPGGASISMVEAASIGLPLVSRKSPIESYALSNDNGFFFEPGNIKELHHILKTLLYDDKLRIDMGRKSRELVEKKLNWKSIALEYLFHYRSILR